MSAPAGRAPGRPKPARIPSGDRLPYPAGEGPSSAAGRAPGRPKPARIPPGDRLPYPAGEGPSSAAGRAPGRPKPARIPSGDRLTYPAGEGPSLTLFDLDDTLLPIDSDHAWGEFIVRIGWVDAAEFARRNDAFYAQYQAGHLDIHEYIAFATEPLRARTPAQTDAAHRRFMAEVIAPQLRAPALALVREHQARGDLVALVTATNDFVTAPIAAALGIPELLAVRLERDAGGTITGRIAGTPSYREGKVTRVDEWLAGQGRRWGDFGRISVYSDSVNDLPLLERATDPVATNPTPALQAVAHERGWRILKLFD